jgi:hypothetical protein
MKLFANKAALHRKQEQTRADKIPSEKSKPEAVVPKPLSTAPSPRNSAAAIKKPKPDLCKTIISKGPTRTFAKPAPYLGTKK